jgi:hypothetical protein
VSLGVVFLPDTALLVPGAGGAADPAAGLRAVALDALAAVDAGERVHVVAPGRRTRVLPHPVGLGLGAAGLDVAHLGVVGENPVVPSAHRADVAASTALVLLRAAGVPGPVDVVELTRTATGHVPPPRPAADVGLLVVVGSLSARHGPDAPLADDPRAAAADAALIAALGSGPAALADALDALGADGPHDLAVSAAGPWRAVLRLIPEGAVEVGALHAEVLAGAQHAVAAWTVTAPSTAPEEPR